MGADSHRHGENMSESAQQDIVQMVQAYGRASSALTSWIEGAVALSLLRRALALGIIDAARSGRTVDEIAVLTGHRRETVDHLCIAMHAHGLLDMLDEQQYTLTSDLAMLASSDAPQVLRDLLAAADVKTRGLDAIGSIPQQGVALPSGDSLLLAAGIGTTALSSARSVAPASMARSMPELHAAWVSGGCHLEIGCGVGNNLLSIVAVYPLLNAVGVEIDGATAGEAQRRANVLGLAGRVEIRCMDARDLTDVAAFDTAQWSQFFFPVDCRSAVLSAARRALRPGGHMFVPLLGDVAANVADRRDPRQRAITINRLLFDSWGIPIMDATQVRAETEAGGFEVLRTMPGPSNPLALTRGMMLARRPADE